MNSSTMMIETYLPLSFSETGQRPANQDALYPSVGLADYQTRVFAICDGMGGADKGEVASHLLCEAIGRYEAVVKPPMFTREHVVNVLKNALAQYADYMYANPLVNRMGSTLALLQLHNQGAIIAHVGDSRIYQVRQGEVIFQTTDHKQVIDMVEAGIITAEQAKTHPWRNRLSRAVAMNSAEVVSREYKIPEPAITHIDDVQEDDYFVLCTDGVLEQIDEYALSLILKTGVSDQIKLQMLLQLCEGKVKDNYSAYLIHVKTVQSNQIMPTNRWAARV